ncbi:cell surface protein [Treponema primitia ZAS-2]|uniref:Cell surface protein n=1 Tax=Treponema primitia (strain ATCC BAA-887 / DSM 12427 / ZAS-2) TaxID=545694 RepID=F5YPV6_TREPZ|nr:leucine-rich repeat domain-containing protein [Treponema primitia]AEF87007.1 cell surface protein [Treponema primitia ZAS-2]
MRKFFVLPILVGLTTLVISQESGLKTDFTNPSSLPLVRNGDYVIRGTVLVQYTGRDAVLTIPESLGITELGDAAFSHSRLTDIVIPKSVKKIGISAFASCYSLKNISFENGIEVIGDSAFTGCSNLIRISFPDSLKVIGAKAFSGCLKLVRITLPANMLYISSSAMDDSYYDNNNANGNLYYSYYMAGQQAGVYNYSPGFRSWYIGTNPVPQAVLITAGSVSNVTSNEAWFMIQLPAEGSLLTAFTGGSRGDPYITVYSINGSKLGDDDDSGGNNNAKIELMATGITYIKVTRGQNYTLNVRVE